MAEQSNSESQYEVLRAKVVSNIGSFRNKRDSNRKLAFRIKITIVSIGALTTIVLGLKSYVDFPKSNEILSSLALVLSALIPIFAAWESFFDHRWLWVRYTGTLNSLYAVNDELEYGRAAGTINKEQLDALFKRLQRALAEVDSEWTDKRKDAVPEKQVPKS